MSATNVAIGVMILLLWGAFAAQGRFRIRQEPDNDVS